MRHIKSLIHQSQETLKINKLSESEKHGTFQNTSFLKFFRGSVIEVPFSLGRTIRGSSFNNIDLDPFSKCLSNQDFLNFDENRFSNELFDYYLIEKSKKVGDFIDIANREIQKLPSWAIAYPWEGLGFYDLQNYYLNLLAENRHDHLESTKSLVLDNDTHSLDYAKSHGKQFKKLAIKITKEGFNKSFSRPKIYILKNTNNWRWLMAGDGNHRAYIMAALQHKTLPVQVSKVLDRSKAYNWPNVKNNEYSINEAQEIFDVVFDGNSCIRGCY